MLWVVSVVKRHASCHVAPAGGRVSVEGPQEMVSFVSAGACHVEKAGAFGSVSEEAMTGPCRAHAWAMDRDAVTMMRTSAAVSERLRKIVRARRTHMCRRFAALNRMELAFPNLCGGGTVLSVTSGGTQRGERP